MDFLLSGLSGLSGRYRRDDRDDPWMTDCFSIFSYAAALGMLGMLGSECALGWCMVRPLCACNVARHGATRLIQQHMRLPQKNPIQMFYLYLFVSFCIYLFTRCDLKIPYWANVLSPADEAFLVQAHFPVPWWPFCESQMRISSYLVTGIEFQCTAWRKIIGKKQTWVACHLVLCEHFGSYPSIPDVSWHNLIWSDLICW